MLLSLLPGQLSGTIWSTRFFHRWWCFDRRCLTCVSNSCLSKHRAVRSSLTWVVISRVRDCENQPVLREDGFIVEELNWDLRFGNSCCPFSYFSSAWLSESKISFLNDELSILFFPFLGFLGVRESWLPANNHFWINIHMCFWSEQADNHQQIGTLLCWALYMHTETCPTPRSCEGAILGAEQQNESRKRRVCGRYWKKLQERSVERDGLNRKDIEWRGSKETKCRS